MADYRVNSGDLRTRITFQKPTLTQDDGGAQVVSWANVPSNPTVYARWINAHGAEVVGSDALRSVQRALVTVRHREDILATCRVLKDGQAWNILSIDPVQGKNRYIELLVEQAKGTV